MKVTAEQFEKFLNAYGRDKLTKDTTAICDPPRTRYCDFTTGKVWPEAEVAHIVRGDLWDDKKPLPNEYVVEDEFAHLVA